VCVCVSLLYKIIYTYSFEFDIGIGRVWVFFYILCNFFSLSFGIVGGTLANFLSSSAGGSSMGLNTEI